jgi:hypothetical protein
MRSLAKPEIPVAIEGDGVEVRTTEVGDMTAVVGQCWTSHGPAEGGWDPCEVGPESRRCANLSSIHWTGLDEQNGTGGPQQSVTTQGVTGAGNGFSAGGHCQHCKGRLSARRCCCSPGGPGPNPTRRAGRPLEAWCLVGYAATFSVAAML